MFYAEQVICGKMLDVEAQLKPYFALNTVLQEGGSFTANQLFAGITSSSVWISRCITLMPGREIFDSDGVGMALFMATSFARDLEKRRRVDVNFVDNPHSRNPARYIQCM